MYGDLTMFDISPNTTAIPQKTRQFYFPPHETQIMIGCELATEVDIRVGPVH